MHEKDQPTQRGSRGTPEGQQGGLGTHDEAPAPHRSDDRRTPVRPTDNPRPSSPAADEESVRKGEETLERVKPY